jgi:hypothetical protein
MLTQNPSSSKHIFALSQTAQPRQYSVLWIRIRVDPDPRGSGSAWIRIYMALLDRIRIHIERDSMAIQHSGSGSPWIRIVWISWIKIGNVIRILEQGNLP